MRSSQTKRIHFSAILAVLGGTQVARAQVGSQVDNWTVPAGASKATDISRPVDFIAVIPCRIVDTRDPIGPYGGPALAAAPRPEVRFNYLGQFDQNLGGAAQGWQRAPRSLGDETAASAHRAHLLDVAGAVAEGRLGLAWTYSAEVHERSTVVRLAERYGAVLGQLIEHCCRPGVGGATPSDFPLARLDQRTVDLIQKRFERSRGTRA